jgi:diguanylate cyclase (GGDEF)-like protein/PAS domain S-box-containing protein
MFGMFEKVFQWRSLKTRVTLTTLAIFLVGIWSLALYASRVLREDMRVLMGEHQAFTTAALASEVNNELKQRFLALANLSADIPPQAFGKRLMLQTWIDQRPITRNLFNAGFLLYRRDGTVVDTDKRLADRLGTSGQEDEAVVIAIREGSSSVSRPVWDTKLHAWTVSMVIPVRGVHGEAVGAVAGWINLAEPNFLNRLTGKRNARTGNYIVLVPKYRQVVMASDSSLVAQNLPVAGIDPLVDRLVEADGEFGLSVDRKGQEMLSTSVRLGAAGWTLSSVLSTDEAFAPIYAMQKRMLLAAVILSLLAGGLTWWMLRRQFAPMLAAVGTLADVTDKGHALRPLDIPKQDEVGALIAGFNRLLQTLGQREQALRESEVRYRTMVERSPEAVVVHAAGDIIYANPAALDLLGAASASELLGTKMDNRLHPDSLALAHRRLQHVQATGEIAGPALMRFFKLDGSVIDVEAQGTPILFDGVASIHTVMHDMTQRRRADEEQRIAATAFESQQGMLVTDGNWRILRVNRAFTQITGYSAQEAIGKTPEELLRSDYHSAAFFEEMFELLGRNGNWQGELWDRRKSGEVFPQWVSITAVKNAAGQVTHYVDTLTDITERKLADEQIQSLAFYDPLTQLPNRRLLMDRLAHTIAHWDRDKRLGALLFVDLDNFKILNDTFGHQMGDLLLQAVAARLDTCIRKGDTVARLGGDEFVIMLEDLSVDPHDAANQAEAVGEKVLAALNQGYMLGQQAHHSTPSIGITLFGASHEGIEEPLKRADLAMYQAKAAGRNTLRFFDPQMQSAVSARAEMETGMREALVREEFLLYYQAQVGGQGEFTGVEVLVRWNHPQRGMVSPAEFIPLAEDTGLILPLGRWVLETACVQLARWAQQPAMAHLAVAVNVSPRQFYQSNFVAEVQNVLQRTGANPQRLKLELTEGLLVSNVEDVIAKMESLQAVGVGFSLDDFGTGYSSLSHLKRLPLDQLKIDQSFVRDILTDPNDAAIANMVIVLGQSLGLTVIAEGVETEAQRAVLAGQGCHAYQGYLFSRPLPLADFEALVRGA